ncbi:DUF1496 domain-containing protein [Alloactinosynnema sp. L-07]|uniref:DUF1496 domain-containing protein n=1 Tax=Alloactinosynnema sp. L-07 TaxID=1653480 RepID=UPI001560DCB3|nr:DUF1496 domain-containing protein [Alloactinosynnema sp. L-07]
MATKVLAVLGVSAGLAVAGPALAFADPEPIMADGCVYAGQNYSDGAIVKVGELYIQCSDGRWSRINY